jgi:hypothetical protein
VTLAVVQSLAFITRASSRRISPSWPAGLRRLRSVCLALLFRYWLQCLSPKGTTFIDLITAVPVLAAYALLLVRGRLFSSLASAALAGVLLGTATALKLTNGVFALGVVGFALAGPDGPRERIVWLLMRRACCSPLPSVILRGFSSLVTSATLRRLISCAGRCC